MNCQQQLLPQPLHYKPGQGCHNLTSGISVPNKATSSYKSTTSTDYLRLRVYLWLSSEPSRSRAICKIRKPFFISARRQVNWPGYRSFNIRSIHGRRESAPSFLATTSQASPPELSVANHLVRSS